MIIDSEHRRWWWFTAAASAGAIAAWYYFVQNIPGGLTGGTIPGLWFGIIGTGLMIYAGLLAAHRRAPTKYWLGSRRMWLKGHIYLGSLAALLILLHANFRFGGPVEQWLMIAFALVMITGVVGLLFQNILPRWITTNVAAETPYEQIPHVVDVMRRNADRIMDDVCGDYDPTNFNSIHDSTSIRRGEDVKLQLRKFYEERIRPLLKHPVPRGTPTNLVSLEVAFGKIRLLPELAASKEKLISLENMCRERLQLIEQVRLHRWLHYWLLVHVPASVAMAVLAVVHIVTALRW